MGMEQNERSEKPAIKDENPVDTRLLEDSKPEVLKSQGPEKKPAEDSVKSLDFNSGKAIEKSDASPKQIAENIAKNGTFGKGDERFDTEMTLSKAMKDGKAKEVVAEINKELAAAGSKYSVQENIAGGGSGSADRVVNGVRTSTRSSSSHGEFTVNGEHGQSDRMALSHGSTERVENGKVVGKTTWSQGENGGSMGSWGKAPRDSSQKNPYPLNDLTLEGYTAKGSTTTFNAGKAGSSMIKQLETRKK
ncbi:MAG: hypothetical protein K2X77_12195 [Candidatus Obscuribacterales bacterium]|nr:hypothetical protein [Candidatus Obscuribacterales bacterium]